MTSELSHHTLEFGHSGRLSVDVADGRVVAAPRPVEAVPDLSAAVDAALASPLDFPPLEQAVIPDDVVALALELGTPGAAELVAGVWRALEKRGVASDNLIVVQPQTPIDSPPHDPRAGLPASVAKRVRWKLHDPDKPNDCAYVAATASGERVYLARDLAEAEVAITVGAVTYDPLLGCRGTNTALYPGLSNRDAMIRAQGQGHDELEPDDDRPLRQLIDEIGWLAGAQFSLQVVPSARGGVANVLAGASETVMRRGRELLSSKWTVEVPARPEIVVAAIDEQATDSPWELLGAALSTCRRLVARGGRIILLTDLDARLGEGMELIRSFESPRDALQPLRKLAPKDLVAASQLAAAADWARIVLLSRLEPSLVEELFLTPATDVDQIPRLLQGTETVAFIPSVQHVHARVRGTSSEG